MPLYSKKSAPVDPSVPELVAKIGEALKIAEEATAEIDAAVAKLAALHKGPFQINGRIARILTSRETKQPILRFSREIVTG